MLTVLHMATPRTRVSPPPPSHRFAPRQSTATGTPTNITMKNSSLSLLLAAAAATSALASFGHHDHHHDHEGHDRVQQHHPRHPAGNDHTHEMLKEHVLRGGPAIATAGGGSGVGLKAGEDAELLHPLAHYLLGFFEWTYKYGQSWGSVQEAFHALQVRK